MFNEMKNGLNYFNEKWIPDPPSRPSYKVNLRPFKKKTKKGFKPDYHLMQVKRIAECSKTQVGISGTTAKPGKRKFVLS